MRCTIPSSCVVTAPAAIAAVLLIGSPAAAVVQTIDANVTAEVEEWIDGAVANFDLAFEDLEETTGNLPLVVEAALVRRDEEGEEVSAARGTTSFQDPRLSGQADPDEFGVDLSAFSRLSGIAYQGRSRAVETREVTFTEDEIGAPAGTALEAASRFFVDGIVVLWGEEGTNDLTGTRGKVTLQVQQLGPGGIDPTTVLTAELTLEGGPEGTVVLSAEGALTADNVTLIDLTDRVPALGAMHLLVIPDLAIPYVYPATVAEPFELTATVSTSIENQPGTGVSVLLGAPLVELVRLIADVTDASVGELLSQVMSQALAASPPPAKPLVADGATTEVKVVEPTGLTSPLPDPLGLCGMLGLESALMLSLFATLTCRRRRSR